MSRAIAPELRGVLRETVRGVPMAATVYGMEAVRELRALLAVARAVARWDRAHGCDCSACESLRCALARLERGRHARGGGR